MAEIKLNKRYKYAGDIFQKLVDVGLDIEAAMDFLNEVEDADVVEVKHGYWIEGKTLEKCSVCGKKGFPDWYYCPHCGAKMDGTPKERGVEK